MGASNLSNLFVKVMLSITSNHIDQDQLLSLMEALWTSARASMKEFDDSLEERLVARLELGCRLTPTSSGPAEGSKDSHSECIRERDEMAQQLNGTTARLIALQDSLCKPIHAASPKVITFRSINNDKGVMENEHGGFIVSDMATVAADIFFEICFQPVRDVS